MTQRGKSSALLASLQTAPSGMSGVVDPGGQDAIRQAEEVGP